MKSGSDMTFTRASPDSPIDDTLGHSPVERVLETVAAAEDCDPTDLPQLADVVDPDALNGLFAPTNGSGSRAGQVSFTYAGYDLLVWSDGSATVSLLDERD